MKGSKLGIRLLYYFGGFFVYNPMLFVISIFHVAIGRVGTKIFPCFAFGLHHSAESLLLGLFGGVLGAGVAWALCALLGSLGGAALSLSWQTAGIAALAAALLSWLSGRLGASGVRK